ncbi:MAG: DUF362 domain-containing protein [Promethearchaeota archaeon]
MISIVPAKPRSLESAREAMAKLLDQLDFSASSDAVLLKPNIVDALPPRAAVDTDPTMVGGLILALRERGASKFIVGENSGYFSSKPENFERLVKVTGYAKLVQQLVDRHGVDVELVNLEFVELEERDWPLGKLKLPALLRDHAYVNFAKMKTHLATTVTLCTKNQKGLLLLADKKKFHLGYGGRADLHECIAELAKLVRPELAVVDATRALEGTGPTQNPEGQTSVRKLGVCVGGTDQVEVDVACCRLMGVDPASVDHLRLLRPSGARDVELAPGSLPLRPADPPFRPAAKHVKFGSLYLHASMWACTGCQMAFARTMRKLTLVPDLTERLRKLQERVGRVDVFVGKTSVEAVTPDLGVSLFFGNCTKKLAEELGAAHVPGCSPDHNEAIEVLLSLVE